MREAVVVVCAFFASLTAIVDAFCTNILCLRRSRIVNNNEKKNHNKSIVLLLTLLNGIRRTMKQKTHTHEWRTETENWEKTEIDNSKRYDFIYKILFP